MSIDVELFDASGPSWQSPSDVYHPFHSRFDPTISFEPNYIEHIDVVTTWKGLTPLRAEELLFWEKAFTDALSSIVEEWLLDLFASKGIELDLGCDDTPMRLLQIQDTVNGLGLESIPCHIAKIVDHMLWYHECSGLYHPWLLGRGDSRIAIQNLIHLHPCIQHVQNRIRVYFSSQLSSMDDLKIYAAVQSKPHALTFHRRGDGMSVDFEPPRLREGGPFYHMEKLFEHSTTVENMWHGVVSTRFPDGVRFERAYRFRIYCTPTNNENVSVSTPSNYNRRESAVGTDRTVQPRRRSMLDEPRQPTLRQLSNGDARVQGVSDFEREARSAHPGLYNTHRDITVGKATMLGKIYGKEVPPRSDVTVNVLSMPRQYADTSMCTPKNPFKIHSSRSSSRLSLISSGDALSPLQKNTRRLPRLRAMCQRTKKYETETKANKAPKSEYPQSDKPASRIFLEALREHRLTEFLFSELIDFDDLELLDQWVRKQVISRDLSGLPSRSSNDPYSHLESQCVTTAESDDAMTNFSSFSPVVVERLDALKRKGRHSNETSHATKKSKMLKPTTCTRHSYDDESDESLAFTPHIRRADSIHSSLSDYHDDLEQLLPKINAGPDVGTMLSEAMNDKMIADEDIHNQVEPLETSKSYDCPVFHVEFKHALAENERLKSLLLSLRDTQAPQLPPMKIPGYAAGDSILKGRYKSIDLGLWIEELQKLNPYSTTASTADAEEAAPKSTVCNFAVCESYRQLCDEEAMRTCEEEAKRIHEAKVGAAARSRLPVSFRPKDKAKFNTDFIQSAPKSLSDTKAKEMEATFERLLSGFNVYEYVDLLHEQGYTEESGDSSKGKGNERREESGECDSGHWAGFLEIPETPPKVSISVPSQEEVQRNFAYFIEESAAKERRMKLRQVGAVMEEAEDGEFEEITCATPGSMSTTEIPTPRE